jgi:hypothetical protein
MNKSEAEPHVADVRPFLPRPGEPAEAYAARLRALHRDLTLVLDAVERGLAASPPLEPAVHEPALDHELEPALAGEPIVVPVADPLPLTTSRRREPPLGAMPRVEVMPPTRERDDEGWGGRTGRRAGEAGAEAAIGAAPPSPASPAPAPAPAEGAPSLPSLTTPPPPIEWAPPPPRPSRGVSPVVLAALIAGWLAAVALLLVVLLGL